MKLILNKLKISIIKITQSYFKIFSPKVECNICGYKAYKFKSTSWHKYCNCRLCDSGIRQRLLFAALTFTDEFSFEKIIENKKILHFAPENYLSDILKSKSSIYKTADFASPGYSYHNIDFLIDISEMKEIDNESFDCVIACDVLEHVPKHIDGIKEVFRILTKGGHCIFTVPQKDNLDLTYEDQSITDPVGREKAYGQSDHLRIYGNDFEAIMKSCGFEVTLIDEKSFNSKFALIHVLFPVELSTNPLATNYRKIFFGKKN